MTDEPTTPELEGQYRGTLDAVNRRDLEAAFAVFAAHGVWDLRAPGLGLYEGREAIRGLYEDWVGTFEDIQLEIEEFRDLGNGVTYGVPYGRGEHSGVALATPATSVAQWRDGVLTHSTVYLDRAQSLRDLGVTEDELELIAP